MLSIVPTPLGNLKDITLRALEVLRATDFIIAENPSHTAKLLQLLELPKKPMVQFADHNEQKVLPTILERLKHEHGALVSDAGTPGISDPGFRLVRACRMEGVEIDSLPGPVAAITALAGSGLPTDKFLFCGFLPKTEPKLITLCTEAQNVGATLVTYESPQRITKTLQLFTKHFAHAQVVVAREISKAHQEYITGTSTEVLAKLAGKPTIKGEITLLISFK
jgi:16S rRNA (cytidine1402-2'-O)-methyltransferase